MSSLETALGDYLAVRRAVGYRLDDDGRLLARFGRSASEGWMTVG